MTITQRLTVRSQDAGLAFSTAIPLSLYIHMPWCVEKCPYCDFNSHALKGDLPEQAYIAALVRDVEQSLPLIWGRRIHSIFIGGGTPSLFSGEAMNSLFTQLRALLPITPGTEITLEANPGTIDQSHFKGYREAGINRLSMGVQSLNDTHLRKLGRIHSAQQARDAYQMAQEAGFEAINLDLMFALPEQTIEEALEDLSSLIALKPSHLSWYQLTLEPNTLFYQKPPPLPSDDTQADIAEAGLPILKAAGFEHYEISAYTRKDPCKHNVNYWQFGDYLGIGAGAHSKLSFTKTGEVWRYVRHRHPKAYLAADNFTQTSSRIKRRDLPFEFMLNALRLIEGVPLSIFSAHTGLELREIEKTCEIAREKGWLFPSNEVIRLTALGLRFLDSVVNLFLLDHD